MTDTITGLLANNKGLLAMDESIATCNLRFSKFGIPQTLENRRRYRELIISTPKLNENISGIILFDETIHQRDHLNIPFLQTIIEAGIIPGIKVDTGIQDLAGFAGEKITEGLDGLRERLINYKNMGARFAKWRAVITIGEQIPTKSCISANANALACYAAVCQEVGLVPIVEPELMMTSAHSSADCFKYTRFVLENVFDQLYLHGFTLESMILKPNMVLPGIDSSEKKSSSDSA